MQLMKSGLCALICVICLVISVAGAISMFIFFPFSLGIVLARILCIGLTLYEVWLYKKVGDTFADQK